MNDARLGRYADAAAVYEELAGRSSDSTALRDYRNTGALYGALAAVPPQRMHLEKDTRISSYRDPSGNQMIPVEKSGVKADFIFDSGANFSCITESQAAKMKLPVIETNIEVGTSTSLKIKTRLAVADTLRMGEILFEHVVFLVLPDEQLSFPEHDFYIHGIIGFPVFYQMGEVKMHRDGEIFVPRTPGHKDYGNLFLWELRPVVALSTSQDTLLFSLDTGAARSELFGNYYRKHRSRIDSLGESVSINRGGAGGIVEQQIVRHPDFRFTLGGREVHMPKIDVTLDHSMHKHLDGNLGLDAVQGFDWLVINFESMYVDIE